MGMDLTRFVIPSRQAMEDDDGVVELSLGLSIGYSSREAPRSSGGRDPGTGSGEAELDRGGSGASMPSSSPPPPSSSFQQGDLAAGLDPQRRREMHAQRRQEARKKLHEKQQKKGSACGGRDGAASVFSAAPGVYGSSSLPPAAGACSLDDRAVLEAQEQRRRVRDREAREEDARHSDWRADESHGPGSDFVSNPELCPSANANPNAGANPNPSLIPNFSNASLPPFGAHPFPVMAMQYPYPQVQYFPMANGFGFPYMMPCWTPAMSSVARGPSPASNIFQPVACRTFQPFSPPHVEQANGTSSLGGKEVDLSGGSDAGIKRASSGTVSLGSNSSSSSAISDSQSNSLQGRSSGSDIRSHSSPSPAENPHPQLSPQASSLLQGQPEYRFSSRQIEPDQGDAAEATPEKRPSSNSTQAGTEEEPSPTGNCDPGKLDGVVSANKPAPAADESTPPPLSSPLPRMPCVSTTGSGPNGKTITGFLYRYTSTEVSIVCVCHGSSFSPAEFVKHAGGTDTANPLKHIIVVPS